jgi:apolipoprotein N-acyltransferase
MVNLLLAGLSGILLWAGFAPIENFVAPYLGIALLFRALINKDFRERMFLAFFAGLAFFLPLLHWSSVYVGSIPWLVLALGESVLFAAVGLFRLQRRWESALIFASLFTIVELLRMKLPFGGFGWGRLGFTQVDSLASLYPIIGVTGISLLISFASLATLRHRNSLYSALLFLIILFYFPVPQSFETSNDTLQITAVQGGVDELGLNFNDRAIRVLERHVDATKTVPGTDLYVWPENAADVDPVRNQRANLLITSLVKTLQTPLLLGAVEETSQGPTNSSLLIGADGQITSRYLKQDLAPFGEYMPLRKLAESISPYAKEVNDFVPGDRWIQHSIKNLPFQSLICFEILDDDHVKNGTKRTAFLVAQTNNATFGRSNEAAQQLQITRSRAAETAREFVVVSTTGFTAHLNSQGRIVDIAEQFRPSDLTMTVHLQNPNRETPAQKLPTWSWLLGLALAICFAGWRLNR